MQKLTNIIICFFIHLLGNVHSQVSVFIAPELHVKMSINSDESFRFTTKVFNNSPYYDYRTSNVTLRKPINYGLTFGVKIKNKHELTFTINSDGNTVFTEVLLNSFSNTWNYTPNSTTSTIKSGFNSYWFNYKYEVFKFKNNTTISPIIGVGLTSRAGPNIWGLSLGTMATATTISENGGSLVYSSGSYTGHKRGWLVNIGLSSDIHVKEKYWFSCSLLYSYSRAILDLNVNTIRVNIPQENYNNTWEHTILPRGSGIYLSVSRKIQLFPWLWKSKKKKGIKD